ncbi:hypothetical protein HYH02_005951 [Chlamydomonas schloesseri]|uniref:Uncharacterized protein n=1 Tax=Chlamydomonas schloesseri TaxID=2026947 RepID=A0A835WK69_9CHLO|nr:hypothetical protein HYH02_005951 [Chlamydomonas schloesseri]|eukprot:KAG2449204.1 hypothetical protein HYH02_005951 [Chlamydomonas schloesseri]
MDSSNGRMSGPAGVSTGESERVAMTPSLHRVASPSPIKAKKRETQKPRLDVTAASVGALKLPTELFQLATSRTLAASHGQADLVLSKALDGIQAAATRLEAERTRLVIQSQELQIWDMAREEELGLLKAENEQLEQQLLTISEKIGKGLGRDGVLESLQFALRKARGERDAEMREADTLFNQLQDAKAAEQELRELRDALTQALLGLEDDWSAVPLLLEEVRKMRARAASGALDPTQLNAADLTTLLRGLATMGKQGVQLQAELQTLRGEKTALATALDAAHAQLAELQADIERLRQQQQAAASTAGSPLQSALSGAAGPEAVAPAGAVAGVAADALVDKAALRSQVQDLNAKLAEYRSYLAENQQEIEQLQGEIQRLRASASGSSQQQQHHHHHHHRGDRSHHASHLVSGQPTVHLPPSQTSHQQQPHNRPHADGSAGAHKRSSSQPLPASQQSQHHLPPHALPQAVHGTPTRHHPSSSSPISTVNYASPPPHVALGNASAGSASPSQLHQQQVAADIAQKVAELQELALRVQQQAAEREAELAAAHTSEIAALRSALEVAQAAAQQELEAVRAALVTQHVQDRRQLEARLQAAADKQVQEREAALAAAHSAALMELNAQLTALAQQHVTALAEREAALAAQHAQALAATEARLGDLHVEAVGAQAAAAAQALQEQAARLEAKHEQQLQELEERSLAAAKRQAEELQQCLAQQHAEAAAQRDAEVRRRHAERLAEQAAQLARLHADQAAALGMQHAEALADREAELTRLHSEALAVREATLLAEAEKQWREREAELRKAFAAQVVEREARLAAAHEEQARAAAAELERLQAAVVEAAAREADLASRLGGAMQEAQAQAEQALRVQLEEVAAAAEAEAVARAAAAHNAVLTAEAEKHQSKLEALRSQLLAESEARQMAALDGLEQANTALQTRIVELESELAQLQQQVEEQSRVIGPDAAAQHAQELQAAVETVERRYVEVLARLGREHEQSAAESRAAAQLREADLDMLVERHGREAAEARREAAEAKRMAAERVGEMQDQLADLQALLDRERRAAGVAAAAAAERLDLMEAELGALRAREEALQREVVPLREEVRRCRWLVRDTQTDLSEMEQELARYKAAASPPISPGAPAATTAPGAAHSPRSPRMAPGSPTASSSSAATREPYQQHAQAQGRDSVPATPSVVGMDTALPAADPTSTSRSPTGAPEAAVGNSAGRQPRASPTAWADGEAVAWPSPQQPTTYRSQGGESSNPADASSRTSAFTPLPPPPPPPAGTPLFTQAQHGHTPVLSQGFQQQQQQRHWDPRASEQDLAAKLVRMLKAGSSAGAEDSFAEAEETEAEASPADSKRSSMRRPAAAPRRALLSEGGPSAAGGRLASAGGVRGFWSWATPQASSRSSAAAAQAGVDAAGAGRAVASTSGPPRPLRRMTADDISSGWDSSAAAMASLADWRSFHVVQRPLLAGPGAGPGAGAATALGSTDAAATAPSADAGERQLGVLNDEEWGDMRGASPLRPPTSRAAESVPATSPSRGAGQAEGSGSGSPVASVSTTSSYNSQTELCFVDEDEDDVEAQQRLLAAVLAESRRVSMAEGQLPGMPPPLPPALVEIQQRRLSSSGGAGEAAPLGRRALPGAAGPSEFRPFRSEGGYSQVTGRATARPDEEWDGDSSGKAEQRSQDYGQAARPSQIADGEDEEAFDMEATLSGPFAAMVIRQARGAGSTTTAVGTLDAVVDEAEDEQDNEHEKAEEANEEDDRAEEEDRFDDDGTGDKHYGGGGGDCGADDDGSVHDRDDSYRGSGHGHGPRPQHPAPEVEGNSQQEDDMEATLSGPFPVLPPGMLLHSSGATGDAAPRGMGGGAEGSAAAPAYGRAGSFDFVPGNRGGSLTRADDSGGAGSSGGGSHGPSPLGLTDIVPLAEEGEQEGPPAEGEEHGQALHSTAAGRRLLTELEHQGAASSGLSSPSYSRGGAADAFPPQYSASFAQPHTEDGADDVWRIWDGGVSAGGHDDGTGEGLRGGLMDEATGSSLASTSSPAAPSQRHHSNLGHHHPGAGAYADAGGGSHSPHAVSALSPVPAFSASPQPTQLDATPPQRMRSSDGVGSFRLSHAASPQSQQQQPPWYRSSVTVVPLMTPNPLYEDPGSASAHHLTHDDAPSMPSTPGSVSSPASGDSVTSPAPVAIGGRTGRTRVTGGSEDSEGDRAASSGAEEDVQAEAIGVEVDEGVPEAEHLSAAVVALPPLRVSGDHVAGDGTRQPSTDTGTPGRYSTATAGSPGSAGRLSRQRSGKRSIQGREAGSSSADRPARSGCASNGREAMDAAAVQGSSGAAAAPGDAAEARSLIATGASMSSSELRKRQRRRMGDFPSPLALSFALDSPAAASPHTGTSALSISAAHQSAASHATAAGAVGSTGSGQLSGTLQPQEPNPASPASLFDPLRQSWEFSCGVATPVSPGHRSRVQGHVVGHSSPASHHQPRNSASIAAAHSPPHPARGPMLPMFVLPTASAAPGSAAGAADARPASFGAGPEPSRPLSLSVGMPQASTPGAQLPPPAPLPTSAAEARARGREVLGRVMGRVASLQGLCAHLSPAASGAGTPLVTSAPGSATGTPRRSVSSWSGIPAPAAAQASISSTAGPAATETSASAASTAPPPPPAASVTTVTPEIIRKLLARHQQQQQQQQHPSIPSPHQQQQRHQTQSPPPQLLAPDDPDLVAGVMGALEDLRSDLFELEKLHQLARLQPPGAAAGAGAAGASRQASMPGAATPSGIAVMAGDRRGDGNSAAGVSVAPAASSAPRLQPVLSVGSPSPMTPAVFGSSTPVPAHTSITGLAAAAAVPPAATPGGNVDSALMSVLAQTVQSQLAGQLGALQAKIADLQHQNQTILQRGGSSPGSGASTAYATPTPHAPGGPAAAAAGGGSHIQQLLGLLTATSGAPVVPVAATPSATSVSTTARAPFSLMAVASAAASGVERGAAAAAAATAIPVGGTATAAGGTPVAPAWGGILVPPVEHAYAAEPPTPSMMPHSSPPGSQSAAYSGAASATPMPSAQAEGPPYAAGHTPGLSTPQPHSGAAPLGLSGAVLWANAPPITPAPAGLAPWASSATAVKGGFPSTGGSRSSGAPSTGAYSTPSPHHHTSMSVYPYVFGHGGPGSGPGDLDGAHGRGTVAWPGTGAGNDTFQAGMRPVLSAPPHQPYSPEELSQLPPGVQLFAPPQLRAAAVAVAHEQQHQRPWQMQSHTLGLGSEV